MNTVAKVLKLHLDLAERTADTSSVDYARLVGLIESAELATLAALGNSQCDERGDHVLDEVIAPANHFIG